MPIKYCSYKTFVEQSCALFLGKYIFRFYAFSVNAIYRSYPKKKTYWPVRLSIFLVRCSKTSCGNIATASK